ncbi:Endonuclease 4 [Candidatus Rubidus massiliensis]|nr:MAG: deoxyribonuclease IV [Chlamydia sp. 32-24]CDZ80907.1 Endonuclease 4 [Candidatus Rubidus massiliensis]
MLKNNESILIGAHTSAAGGVQNALYEGRELGATTIQLFTANQKRWAAKPLDNSTIDQWKLALSETGIKEVMSHDSYLINLGSPDAEMLSKSRATFSEEVKRCTSLGITYLNFHPGAAKTEDPQACLDKICESLLLMKPLLSEGKTRLLLETTAGQGSAVGWKFEHLGYIINKIQNEVPIGVCIDTCHIFVAGYDIRTKEAFDNTLNEFDQIVGLKHLYAFHLNDSVKGLGSRVDRHANLGEGAIGIEAFKLLMTDPRTKHLPKYLETPNGETLWKKELTILKEFALNKDLKA